MYKDKFPFLTHRIDESYFSGTDTDDTPDSPEISSQQDYHQDVIRVYMWLRPNPRTIRDIKETTFLNLIKSVPYGLMNARSSVVIDDEPKFYVRAFNHLELRGKYMHMENAPMRPEIADATSAGYKELPSPLKFDDIFEDYWNIVHQVDKDGYWELPSRDYSDYRNNDAFNISVGLLIDIPVIVNRIRKPSIERFTDDIKPFLMRLAAVQSFCASLRVKFTNLSQTCEICLGVFSGEEFIMSVGTTRAIKEWNTVTIMKMYNAMFSASVEKDAANKKSYHQYIVNEHAGIRLYKQMYELDKKLVTPVYDNYDFTLMGYSQNDKIDIYFKMVPKDGCPEDALTLRSVVQWIRDNIIDVLSDSDKMMLSNELSSETCITIHVDCGDFRPSLEKKGAFASYQYEFSECPAGDWSIIWKILFYGNGYWKMTKTGYQNTRGNHFSNTSMNAM